jgi:hypothetical protein
MSDPFLRGVLTAFLGLAIGLLIYFYADNFRRDILTAVSHCDLARETFRQNHM